METEAALLLGEAASTVTETEEDATRLLGELLLLADDLKMAVSLSADDPKKELNLDPK